MNTDPWQDETIAPPEHQYFTTFSVLVPKEKGKRQYERVTITSSPRNIANDLNFLLSSTASREVRSKKLSICNSQKLRSLNSRRDEYTIFCSCGHENCEHIQYGIRHFEIVQQFSHQYDRLRKTVNEKEVSDRRIAELEKRLVEAQLQQDEELLREAILLKELLEQEKEIRKGLETEIANNASNFEAMMDEIRQGKSSVCIDPIRVSNQMLNAFEKHFVLPDCKDAPGNKREKNVESDHHRANPKTLVILDRLSDLSFVRKVGLDYRHNIKHRKIHLMPEFDQLELHLPYKAQADIIRIAITAQTKLQQLCAAFVIADMFDAKVQGA